MKGTQRLGPLRRVVLWLATLLFGIWLALNIGHLVLTQNGFIRFSLCLVFALLILLRKKEGRATPFLPTWTVLVSAIGGTCATIAGIILPVAQLEWLGLILVLLSCLQWSLPASHSRDSLLALALLYWAHPLPSQVFTPMQYGMQFLSVEGTEWFLHLFNVRVWADGFVLHTGVNVYDVPHWCSGMRTATTVVLVAAGLGFIKRLRPRHCVILVIVALFQSLLLNIIRLSSMVVFAPKVGGGSNAVFLHDTTGIISLAGVFLVYLELLYLEYRERKRIELQGELNPFWMKVLTEHPPIWRIVLEYKWVFLSVIAFGFLAAELAHRSRISHRAEMIKGVVEILRDTRQLELAQKAAEDVRSLVPYSVDWEMAILRLLLMRGEYDRVLKGLDSIPSEDEMLVIQKNILAAYCHMGLGDLKTAARYVGTLPEQTQKNDPRAAMILAEMAHFSGDIEGVANNVTTAMKWRPNINRVRAMYPYLRAGRKWRAIAATDVNVPYRDPTLALCAIEAHMNLNAVPRVASLTLYMLRMWPNDPRTLEPLFFLASKKVESQWEPRFASQLRRSARQAEDADTLYVLFRRCLHLGRADLLWALHLRIEELDPSYPGLKMNAVVNARQWFSFRKRYLGMQAPKAVDRIDLRSLYRLASGLNAWKGTCARIPCGEDLSPERTVQIRKSYLDEAIKEFRKRDAADALSLVMKYEYVKALEMAGEIEWAKRQLDHIAVKFPGQRTRTRIVLSEIHERRGDWQQVYETLRKYVDEDVLHLAPLLRLSRAQAHLRLGIASVDTARKAFALFPSSTQAIERLASALKRFDSPEEALFLLSKPRVRQSRALDVLEAQTLHASQRFEELDRFCRASFISPPDMSPGTVQRPYLPRAEVSMLRHRVFIPSEDHFKWNAEMLERNRDDTTSPFIRNLTDLWLAHYRRRDRDAPVDIEKWVEGGRDNQEKAILLNQLTVLLCREYRYSQAREVAIRAVKIFPESPQVWRFAASLCGPDLALIRAARDACPSDSDLWLADLVVTTQIAKGIATPVNVFSGDSDGPDASSTTNGQHSTTVDLPGNMEQWVLGAVKDAEASQAFSPAAMTRAGDYLFRGGFTKAACVVARDADAKARSLLPAYVLAIRCAIVEKDKDWALDCTERAIASALRPPTVFYERFVRLKSDTEPIDIDNEMVEALKVLRRDDSENPLWAQILGYVRFQRGGWEVIDALQQMTTAIEYGATNRTPYVIAAESARLLDGLDRATELLREGLSRYPNDMGMMNNLVFTLSLAPEGIEEALDRLPALMQQARNSLQVLDTASVVYTRSGLLDDAETILKQILLKVEEGSRSWFRASTRSAEVKLLRGDAKAALKDLHTLIHHSAGMPDDDVLVLTRLIDEAELAKAEQELRDSGT
ncbi:MAG: archaeosortase/exosortase family protein [Kiritimatiellia bacterium]|nr:archaeosortase/exosortase family protein [Kiritimatiellia bacterium]